MGFEKERKQLDELKVDSLTLRGEIRERLINLEKQLSKKRRFFHFENDNAALASELLKTFGDENWEADVFISAYGKAYFDLRIQREKNANSFLAYTLDALKKLDGATDKEIVQKLKDLKTDAEKFKNGEILQMESMIKANLTNLFTRTIEDLENYKTMMERIGKNKEGATESREQTKKKETLALIKKAKMQVEACKTLLDGIALEDTAETKAVALVVKEKLEECREVLLSGVEFRVEDKMKELQKALNALKETKGKKKIKEKDADVGGFPEATIENLRNGEEVDNLSAAAFVLQRVGYGQEFFDMQKEDMLRALKDSAKQTTLEGDEYYQELLAQLNEMYTEMENMPEGPAKDIALDRAYALADRIDAREIEILEDAKHSFIADNNVSEALWDFVLLLKKAARLFGVDSQRKYLERAQIMADSEISDFQQLYEDYVSAVMNNDKKTISELDIKVNSLLDKYDNPQKVESVKTYMRKHEPKITFQTTEKTPVRETMSQKERDEKQAKIAARLGRKPIAATPNLVATETPVTDGVVQTVNTNDYATEKAKEMARKAREANEEIV